MCNLIPPEIWENIASTFLEPSCGNGNFLVEILHRKLERCETEADALTACGSIYGVDIMPDNVAEARQRCCAMVRERFPTAKPETVFESNIVVGDFLRPETISFLRDEATS